jgi:transcriptional regulator with XRE-family HTH domain
MPRFRTEPVLAETPEDWLVWFRQARRTEDGDMWSPELLGTKVGVSGSTVRRWENGSSTPTEEDIHSLAAVLGLTSFQKDFLRLAFQHSRLTFFPNDRRFREHARFRLAASRSPACLFDDLFYLRAWNGTILALGGLMAHLVEHGTHPVECLLLLHESGRNRVALSRDSLRQVVRAFWIYTARLCGSPGYTALVRRLGERRVFVELWRALAIDDDPTPVDFSAMTEAMLLPGSVKFRVYQSTILFPPEYLLAEFVSANEAARARVEAMKDEGSEEAVHFHKALHWAA